jgi:valacyclovir hydrolase
MELYAATRDVSRWSKAMRATLAPVYGGEEALQALWSGWYAALEALHEGERGGEICTAEASAVAAKTLILHGQRDALVPEFHADYLHERILHSRLHLLPEGKHNLHLRFAGEVNALISGFLAEPDDARTASREFVRVPGFDVTGKVAGDERPAGPRC